MKNNNRTAIRRLSSRSLKNNSIRNLFAICAIILTSMLFTAVFSLFSGIIQASEENTMREVGTRAHAGLKNATMQQYEQAAADPSVKKCNYNIFIGFAENIQKRQAEIRFMPFEEALPDYFISLAEGHMPKAEDEILVDTYILDELKVPHTLGSKVTLTFQFMGELVEKEFQVCGYYNGDAISHASELFLSERFWLQLKGSRTEADFAAWGKEHPNENGQGLLSVNLTFSNASHLEDKVQTLIQNMGYEPGTELDYGINWAYMENRLESIDPISYFIAGSALVVILLTGYLIIYNIFQISIMSDIRFYGLLKTIGTTKKQLRQLILRQVIRLSVIGIPIGLLAGYFISCLLVPMLGKFLFPYAGLDISLQFHPLIVLFGAVFSAVTVFLSCRKPGKIAGSVSPVEAVKYTETAVKLSAKKQKRHSFSPVFMALANLKRSRKKTAVVIAALSLSIILLTIVMTGVSSFHLDQFLEERIAGDIVIGNAERFRTASGGSEFNIDEDYIEFADSQPGIEASDEMWLSYRKSIKIDQKGTDSLLKLEQEGKLEQTYSISPFKLDSFPGYMFGYTNGLFKNIKVLDGSLDVEKFQNGDYILLNCFYGNDLYGPEDSPYHPGDKVTVLSHTKDTTSTEIKNDAGEVTHVVYDHLAEKEYEVMAIIDCPRSMNLSRYVPNGMDAVLPLKEFQNEDETGSILFAKSYQIQDNSKDSFTSALKNYKENINPLMGFTTKQVLEKEFSGMIGVMSTIGISLSAVVAFIGILNFINAIFTSIISRKREFAMLQSIGMTTRQLKQVIICEGISYIAAACILSLILGTILAYAVLHALNNILMFFEYQFQILPYFIMLPILSAVAVITPILSLKQLQKESVVDRLREAE